MNINASFQWECQPIAENFALAILQQAIQANQEIATLSEELLVKTNTRLFDWLDFVYSADVDQINSKLNEAGYVLQSSEGKQKVFHHPKAQLPRVIVGNEKGVQFGVGVSVDAIADFLLVRGEHRSIEGSYFGNFRKAQYSTENNAALWIVEKRGTLDIMPTQEDAATIMKYAKALESWMNRSRSLQNEDEAMEQTLQLAKSLIREIGQHRAAWTVLEGERRYWQARNTAGQIQKNRQDRLGMGWANHDHHTFRSSRRRFKELVHLFELLGFHCRERFYAGEEAGWGAQVMENPVCRLVLFLDVDLGAHEVISDFAHEQLSELDSLGTVGLWCALHGDSILKSGMHHLEAQFMFDELTENLSDRGIKMMSPFSSFPYLKQAFTVGENWRVDPSRVYALVKEKKITKEQGEKFLEHGAIGSHLENLQRREGFKGFNQKSVNIIIKKTDPRLQEDGS